MLTTGLMADCRTDFQRHLRQGLWQQLVQRFRAKAAAEHQQIDPTAGQRRAGVRVEE